MNFDPFAQLGSEQTVIRPTFGRESKNLKANSPSFSRENLDQLETSEIEDWDGLASLCTRTKLPHQNPLIKAYYPLIRLLGFVSEMHTVAHMDRLAITMSRLINEADQTLNEHQSSKADQIGARYLICSFADEVAASTPWGSDGHWAPLGMLMKYFQETWGGEKSFSLMQKLLKSSVEHHNLLELSHWLVLLGFQGRFKLLPEGANHLRSLSYELGNRLKLNNENRLSSNQLPSNWRPAEIAEKPSPWQIPIWLPISFTLFLVGALWSFYRFDLSSITTKTSQQLAGLNIHAPTEPEFKPVLVRDDWVPSALVNDIARGRVTLKETSTHWIISLVGDTNFSSVRAELNDPALELIKTIAAISNRTGGPAEVIGHTDSMPIRNLSYPTNFALSAERARQVSKLLLSLNPSLQINSRGLGDTAPVASNEDPTGRARNRRVEIHLPKRVAA